ncbi:hypothetical protein LCGC14_1530210 [marine sediment metagenome]|uniref:Uncharacterized protein n=1 Tax=marine sediment metagenome TaxID=412755 RepID=A0A0F9IWE9_9ZZZZ
MDADENGLPIRAWRWDCSSDKCRNAEAFKVEEVPPYWLLEDEDDIESRSLCPDCVMEDVQFS